MKKIISLMLVLICVMSLVLFGCGKDVRIERTATIQEVLDTLNEAGYTNIEHKDGTCEYTVSGIYDFVFSINQNASKPEDLVECVIFDFNQLNTENKAIIKLIFDCVVCDEDIVNDAMHKFQEESNSKEKSQLDLEYSNLSLSYCNFGILASNSYDMYRYNIDLYISLD